MPKTGRSIGTGYGERRGIEQSGEKYYADEFGGSIPQAGYLDEEGEAQAAYGEKALAVKKLQKEEGSNFTRLSGVRINQTAKLFSGRKFIGDSGGGTGTISNQRATESNSDQKRRDDIDALSYFQFEGFDTSQKYANAGDTMPLVFAFRKTVGSVTAGGVWVSVPLLDVGSKNFERTYIYLVTQGSVGQPFFLKKEAFVGKRCLGDFNSSGISIDRVHTSDSTVCPISSYDITCDHSNFYLAIDSLSTSDNSEVIYRTVDKYTTGITIRAKPIYPEGTTTGTLTTYDLQVTRLTLDGIIGPSTTVGTFTTSDDTTISSISDSPSADAYVYVITNTGENTTGTVEPESILLEVQQNNTFPTSYDRTSSYYDMTLAVVEGNMYDLDRSYSDPTGLKQLHLFITNGLDAIDTFPEVATWFVENVESLPNYAIADNNATEFNNAYNITFNGIVSSSTNFLSWAQQVAPMFLLSFYVFADTFIVEPLLPITAAYTIDTTPLTPQEAFDDNEINEDTLTNAIISGSYSKAYIDADTRRPFQAVVSWRGQDEYGMETTKTTKIRYADYSEDVPEEAFDMTAFATNVDHVTIFAKYVLATRRYSTHKISFDTPRNVSTLFPYSVISVTLNRINSQGDSQEESDFYLVTGVAQNKDGVVSIEAEHFPVDETNASIISNSIVSGSFVVET